MEFPIAAPPTPPTTAPTEPPTTAPATAPPTAPVTRPFWSAKAISDDAQSNTAAERTRIIRDMETSCKAAKPAVAAKDSTNNDKGFFASIQSIDTPDPMTVVLNFKHPSLEALYHLGTETAVIIDEKSAATEATAPVGTGPYKLSSWTKGASITLDKWDGYREPAQIPLAHATFRFISDPSAAVAAMLAGDVDAFPRFANVQALGQFRSDQRFQVLVGGTEGKTILA